MTDLKSVELKARGGSSPLSGTTIGLLAQMVRAADS
jgi:hypothetical protein